MKLLTPHPSTLWQMLAAQCRDYGMGIAICVGIIGAVLGITVFLGSKEFSYYMRDVAAIAQLWPSAGALSQMGLLLWALGAGICLPVMMLYWQHHNSNRAFGFYASIAALTVILMLDDTFMLHEVRLPYFGIQESAVLTVYVTLIFLHFLIFLPEILQRAFLTWSLAMGCFALSCVADAPVMQYWWYDFVQLEEVFKLLGIGLWLCWIWQNAKHDLTRFAMMNPL